MENRSFDRATARCPLDALTARPVFGASTTRLAASPESENVIQFAAAHRIPFEYEGDFIVREGGLLSYGPDLAEVGERQASLLDKILHGANAGDLPFERPTMFTLAVNVKTAKALTLVIPPTMLARADEVVE